MDSAPAAAPSMDSAAISSSSAPSTSTSRSTSSSAAQLSSLQLISQYESALTSGHRASATAAAAAAGAPWKDGQGRAQRYREVGNQATWSLSSCKPGFGVEQLRDDSMETYWQSDGQLPHLVNIQFRRKTTVSDVQVYTDFKLDESYTPSKISVRQEIEVIDLNEPAGWQVIPLKDLHGRAVRAFMVQVAITANHQQGRDTHLRQIKIHSPLQDNFVSTCNINWSPASNSFLYLK